MLTSDAFSQNAAAPKAKAADAISIQNFSVDIYDFEARRA
jgi:hypothetical protein